MHVILSFLHPILTTSLVACCLGHNVNCRGAIELQRIGVFKARCFQKVVCGRYDYSSRTLNVLVVQLPIRAKATSDDRLCLFLTCTALNSEDALLNIHCWFLLVFLRLFKIILCLDFCSCENIPDEQLCLLTCTALSTSEDANCSQITQQLVLCQVPCPRHLVVYFCTSSLHKTRMTTVLFVFDLNRTLFKKCIKLPAIWFFVVLF